MLLARGHQVGTREKSEIIVIVWEKDQAPELVVMPNYTLRRTVGVTFVRLKG